tara:strand:+ start:894 stop:1118 length:225 start_codon:yes stop_codon:yes gene_type:complete
VIWAIRGTGITAYLKVGYNIVRRYKRESEPNDVLDCFMWLGYSKTLKDAKKLAAKQEGATEIREFKIQQLEKDL